MLRNKKGVTLIILVISIILMFIIFGITVSSGTELLRDSQKSNIKTTLYLVKARAANVLDDYLFDGTGDLGDDADSTYIANVGFTEDEETYIYKLWDSDRLDEEGIDTSDVESNEYFIIQYNIKDEEVDVATTKGYTDSDGNTTYILSQFD